MERERERERETYVVSTASRQTSVQIAHIKSSITEASSTKRETGNPTEVSSSTPVDTIGGSPGF